MNLTRATSDVQKGDVVREAFESGVQLVFFLYCDSGGSIRGKGTHVSGLESRMDTGIGLTVAMQAMSDMDVLQGVEGMGPVGEVRLLPDPDTFAILPYAPTRATVMSHLVKLDREPWEACPRNFLERMIQRAADMDITIQAAFEPEWTLANKVDGTYVPCDDSLDNSSVGMTTRLPLWTTSSRRWPRKGFRSSSTTRSWVMDSRSSA